MTEVNNDTLISKTDQTGKREFRKKKQFFQKRQNNYDKINTRFLAKFSAAILYKPYYTPLPHVIWIRLLHPWEI
jgi:hypothetical protein